MQCGETEIVVRRTRLMSRDGKLASDGLNSSGLRASSHVSFDAGGHRIQKAVCSPLSFSQTVAGADTKYSPAGTHPSRDTLLTRPSNRLSSPLFRYVTCQRRYSAIGRPFPVGCLSVRRHLIHAFPKTGSTWPRRPRHEEMTSLLVF